MELSTRRAEPADRGAVEELLAAVADEAATMRGGPAAMELWAEGKLADPATRGELIDAAFADGSLRIWLARFEGADVGLGLLRLVGDGARVELAYVLKEARGVGVGDALLEALVGDAREAGAAWLDALALPGDRETKSLYERGGLVAREITLRRSLEG